ncbi:MAG: RNA polymerase sigma factor [Lentisphaeraceae bacterium]|nr:RNA polymerase sigma factor [Lentisphaeraceae bacterium]
MEQKWNTRQTLIQRAHDPQDHNAWDDFVSYYQTFIRMVLQKSKISINESDDLVQDILLKVWKGLPNYEYRQGKAKFRSWLSKIIRNTTINFLVRVKSKDADNVELDERTLLPVSEAEIEKVINNEWVTHLTQMAMEKVKEVFSGQAISVFELSMKGKSAREIGAELSITEESVFVLRSRIKKRLRREISKLRSEIEFS